MFSARDNKVYVNKRNTQGHRGQTTSALPSLPPDWAESFSANTDSRTGKATGSLTQLPDPGVARPTVVVSQVPVTDAVPVINNNNDSDDDSITSASTTRTASTMRKIKSNRRERQPNTFNAVEDAADSILPSPVNVRLAQDNTVYPPTGDNDLMTRYLGDESEQIQLQLEKDFQNRMAESRRLEVERDRELQRVRANASQQNNLLYQEKLELQHIERNFEEVVGQKLKLQRGIEEARQEMEKKARIFDEEREKALGMRADNIYKKDKKREEHQVNNNRSRALKALRENFIEVDIENILNSTTKASDMVSQIVDLSDESTDNQSLEGPSVDLIASSAINYLKLKQNLLKGLNRLKQRCGGSPSDIFTQLIEKLGPERENVDDQNDNMDEMKSQIETLKKENKSLRDQLGNRGGPKTTDQPQTQKTQPKTQDQPQPQASSSFGDDDNIVSAPDLPGPVVDQ